MDEPSPVPNVEEVTLPKTGQGGLAAPTGLPPRRGPFSGGSASFPPLQ